MNILVCLQPSSNFNCHWPKLSATLNCCGGPFGPRWEIVTVVCISISQHVNWRNEFELYIIIYLFPSRISLIFMVSIICTRYRFVDSHLITLALSSKNRWASVATLSTAVHQQSGYDSLTTV
jgi:hypothetical protein